MKHRTRLVAVLMAASLLSGCGHTDTARFYSLRDAVEATPPQRIQRVASPPIVLASVRVADYLRRPQLVQRVGPYQMQYLEHDRWAGQLDQELSDVLMEALSAKLEGVHAVVRDAGKEEDGSVRIKIEILQMELDPYGAAWLKARWSRSDERGVEHVVCAHNTGEIGAAHRANLGDLAARIVDSLLASSPPAELP